MSTLHHRRPCLSHRRHWTTFLQHQVVFDSDNQMLGLTTLTSRSNPLQMCLHRHQLCCTLLHCHHPWSHSNFQRGSLHRIQVSRPFYFCVLLLLVSLFYCYIIYGLVGSPPAGCFLWPTEDIYCIVLHLPGQEATRTQNDQAAAFLMSF